MTSENKRQENSTESCGLAERRSSVSTLHKSSYLKTLCASLTAHASRLKSLLHLRMLKCINLPQKLLSHFHSCTSESVWTPGCTVWYFSCTAAERKNLQQVVNTAQRTVSSLLSHLSDSYLSFPQKQASNIFKDPLTFWTLPVHHPPIRADWELPEPEQTASPKQHTPDKQV